MSTITLFFRGLVLLQVFVTAAHSIFLPVEDDTNTTLVRGTEILRANSGLRPSMIVRNGTHALVRFDLSNFDILPPDVARDNILSASLEIYPIVVRNPDQLQILAVTSPWRETSSGPAPSLGGIVEIIPTDEVAARRFISVNVTEAVRTQLSTGVNHGFAIATTNPATRIGFASKNGNFAGMSPRLRIVSTPFINRSNGTNALFGPSTGNRTMTGANNTIAGIANLVNNTTGASNTAMGWRSLRFNTTGGTNSAFGVNALTANTIGVGNTALGVNALQANTQGILNTAAGVEAGQNITTGILNSAFGRGSLGNTQTGGSNVAMGADALLNLSGGSNNAALGTGAGSNLITGSSNLYLATNGGASAESGTTRIGSSQTRTFISGIRGVTTGSNNAISVLIDSNGQLGTISSSARYKENIEDMAAVSERLHGLRPVVFRYREAFECGSHPSQFGLIAEEVATAFPELVVLNEDGLPETVKYQDLSVLLLNELQRERNRTAMLEKQLHELNSTVTTLMEKTDLLARQMEERTAVPVALWQDE